MDRKRLTYADMFKGLGILAVVFYHISAPGYVKALHTLLIDAMLLAFFFYAGYFYKPGKRSILENIKSRAKSLLVPFFMYSLIFWFVGTIYNVFIAGIPLIECVYCLRNFYLGSIWSRVIQDMFNLEYYSLGKRYLFLADFWFLIALLLASILFYIIADFSLKSRKRTIAVVIILFAITGVLRSFSVNLAYNLQLTPFFSAFLLLGAFFKKEGILESGYLSGIKEIVAAVVSLVLAVVVFSVKEVNLNMYRGSFPEEESVNMVLTIISSLLFIFGLSVLLRAYEQKGYRTKELTWLGNNSMTIYIYHMFVVWLLSVIFGFSLMHDETPALSIRLIYVLIAIITIVLCCIIQIITDKIKYLF